MIIDRIFYTLARRWLLFINLAVGIYVGSAHSGPGADACRDDRPGQPDLSRL